MCSADGKCSVLKPPSLQEQREVAYNLLSLESNPQPCGCVLSYSRPEQIPNTKTTWAAAFIIDKHKEPCILIIYYVLFIIR